MLSPKWGVALLLVVLTTGLLLLLRADPTGSVPPVAPGPHATAESAAPPTPAAEAGAAPLGAARAGSEPAPARRRPLPDTGPPDAPGRTVRVVSEDGRTPVPEAQAWFLEHTPENEDRRREAMDRSPPAMSVMAFVERHGRPLVLDARGEARLPRDREGVVAARAGDRTGLARVTREASGPILVVLRVAVAATIEVVDSTGRPLGGVPVGLRIGSRVVWSDRTNADGTARPLFAALPEGTAGGPWTAFLAFPHGPVVSGVVDPTATAARIRLVAPPTGSLEVWVEGLEAVQASRGRVVALAAGAPELALSEPTDARGRALLEPIGVGTSLVVEAAAGDAAPTARAEIEGPATPGQRVTVRLQLGRGRPVLVGRVVDERGRPLVACSLDVSLRARTSRAANSMGTRIRTDEKGRFSLAVQDNLGPEAERTLALREPTAASGGKPPRSAHVQLAPLHPGPNDLGDLPLTDAPLVAQGLVVDLAGRPVVGASVRVLHDDDGAPLPLARSGEDGSFACRGRVSAANIRLAVSHPKFLPARSDPLPPGATGVRVVLRRAGIVEGRVEMPAQLESFQVRIMLRRHGAGQGAPDAERTPDDDGAFRFVSVAPGLVRVEVSLLGDPSPCFTAEGVVVRPGETTRDPRLQHIELEGTRVLTLRVVDENGRPLPEAFVLPISADAGLSRRRGYRARNGTVRLATTRARPDVLAWARSKRAVVARAVRDGQTLRLGPPIRLRVRLPRKVLPPPPPYALAVELVRPPRPPVSVVFLSATGSHRIRGRLPWEPRGTRLLRGGETVLEVARAGTYGLQWWVVDRDSRRRQPLPPGPTVRLAETDVEKLVPAGFTAEDLARAIRALR